MRRIGKYQLQERIGVGGFGEVYKGFDPYIKRPVAIKTCHSQSDDVRSRFFQEAEIAGNLHHRNITTVYDFGVDGDLPYLIQEYLEGEDLDAKIKRRDYLPLAEKLLCLIQIARGLAHAHEAGVIHRDIKPANVRVLADGTTKIMDFGIAKLARTATGLTQTGMTLGTAAYLSPEQIRGETVSPRTDVYSFGVTAYELLTFERPFEGEQISSVLYRVLHDSPRPIPEMWPTAPAALVALVDRCLQKDAAARYADGAALLAALESVQRSIREHSGVYGGASDGSDDEDTQRTVEIPRQGSRAQGSRAPGSPAAQPPSDLHTVPHPTPRTAPVVPSLGDLDLDGRSAPPPTAQVPIAREAKSHRWPLAAAAFLLVAAAAAAGWWLGRIGPEPVTELPLMDSARVAVEDRVEEEESSTPAQTSPTASSPAASPAAVSSPQGPPPETRPAPPVSTPPPPPTATPPPPRPAPARTGTLVVRPLPRRPHGQVWVDGRFYGQTPLRDISLDAGRHPLEIRPLGAGDSLRRLIEIDAESQTVITFDFAAGTIREARKASASN